MGVPPQSHSWMFYKGKSHLEMNDDWGYPYFRKSPQIPPWMSQQKSPTGFRRPVRRRLPSEPAELLSAKPQVLPEPAELSMAAGGTPKYPKMVDDD